MMRNQYRYCQICKIKRSVFQRGDGKWVCAYITCTNGVIVKDKTYYNQRKCKWCDNKDCSIIRRNIDGNILYIRMPTCVACNRRSGACKINNCRYGRFWEMSTTSSDNFGKLSDYCYMHHFHQKRRRGDSTKRHRDASFDENDDDRSSIRNLHRKLRDAEEKIYILVEECKKLSCENKQLLEDNANAFLKEIMKKDEE